MWSPDQIADAISDALRAHDAGLRDEQAVYGLDALDELKLHAIIAQGLATANFGVLREQPFPHEWTRKQSSRAIRTSHIAHPTSDIPLPIPRDRMRCDLVLTPQPNQSLSDSLTEEKTRRAEAKELEGTLFEALSTSHLAPGSPSSPALAGEVPEALRGRRGDDHQATNISPENAYWLELKTLGQYTNTSGLPGPNRKYTTELTRNPLADLTKLAADDRIHQAAAALILFAQDEPTARHDLNILMQRARAKVLPITLFSPHTRHFTIPDRIGNTICTTCLIAIRKE
jgi:hypothetical protein